jgi:hypothetical protein
MLRQRMDHGGAVSVIVAGSTRPRRSLASARVPQLTTVFLVPLPVRRRPV